MGGPSANFSFVGPLTTTQQQADGGAATVDTLAYDYADQLTKSDLSGGTTGHNYYNYDPAGNRLLEATLSGTTAGQFNSLNQLKGLTGSAVTQTVAGHTSASVSAVTVDTVPATISSATNFSASVSMPSGTNLVSVVAQPTGTNSAPTTQLYHIVASGTAPTQLSYDANGNVLTDESGNTYTWDALNRLTKIAYAGTAYYTTFAYDGLGRRIQIVDNLSSGTTTKNYLWIGSEIAEERNASNSVTKRFFPQGEQQAGTNYYYTRDHLGSVRELCSSTGAIVARYSYDPYGRITLVSGANMATPQYGGYYVHQPSGLSLAAYRAYDANTGRWLSRDPIAENGGINIYDYVDDNPICDTDPSGLDSGWQMNIPGSLFSGPGDPNNMFDTNVPVDPNRPGAALPGQGLKGKCIQVCSVRTGKCITVPIVDAGPHHTNDPYWNKPNGRPKAESEPGNQSGIDLTPAAAAALGVPYTPGSGPSKKHPNGVAPTFNAGNEGDPGMPMVPSQNSDTEPFDWQFVPCPSNWQKGFPWSPKTPSK